MSNKTILFLLFILAIAAFFRLWQLDSIPPGLYPDVAINGNEALESLKTGKFKVFYPENNGREGLMMWLIAISFSIFGTSIWSIKIVAATIGILTILGLYLLTKELFNNLTMKQFGNETIALLSSFFLAVSFWHVNFSRIGFRAILLPFILVFVFYFLFKGFQKQNFKNFVISGIFFGLGFYTYTPFRMAVLILLFVLTTHWLIYKKQNLQKQFLLSTFYFLFSIFVVTLPLGIYFLQNPQDFIGRAAPISIFATENPLKEFGKSLILHLGMFNFYGDPNWRHNISGSPILFWPIGILFLIGIFLSIKELIFSIKTRDFSLLVVHCLLLSWFIIMLLPGILTYEGIPHALRTIGVIPVVYILAGFGGYGVYQWFDKIIKSPAGKPSASYGVSKKLLLVACLLLFIALTYGEFCRYFSNWGKGPEVENAFSKDYVEIGNYLNELPPKIQKYVIVNQPGVPVPWPDGIPMPAQTIMFIEATKFSKSQSIYLLPEDLDKVTIKKGAVIVPMRYDKQLFDELSRRFPQGQIQQKEGIWIYEI